MDGSQIIDGLIFYIELVVLLTARSQGRLSLNPIVHVDPIGTVLLPLAMIFIAPAAVSRFLVGWAKPVPVNLANLGKPFRDDILIALAGPAMNLLLAVVLVGLARISVFFGSVDVIVELLHGASLSLLLCFFNLIPIPPLDGSHVLRNFIGMSWETYWNLCRFGVIPIIIVLNIPGVRSLLGDVTDGTLRFLMAWFGFPGML